MRNDARIRAFRLPSPLIVVVAVAVLPAAAEGAPSPSDVQRGLASLVASKGGPPGRSRLCTAAATRSSCSAGRADINEGARRGRPTTCASPASPRPSAGRSRCISCRAGPARTRRHDRPALLPGMPPAWGAVTVAADAQPHSGLPDYTSLTASPSKRKPNPRGYVPPRRSSTGCATDALVFAPGSQVRVLEHRQHRRRPDRRGRDGEVLQAAPDEIVFGPATCGRPRSRVAIALPRPFIHGYLVAPGPEARGRDARFLSPSGAWASGAIVSTPPTSMPSSAPTSVCDSSAAPSSAADALRCRWQIQSARPGQELGWSGPLPLQDPVRDGLRPHRKLPRLRPVRGRHRERQAGGHDLAQHSRPHWRTPGQLRAVQAAAVCALLK